MRTLNNKKIILIVLAIVLLVCGIIGGVYLVRNIEDTSDAEPTFEEIILSRLHAYETDLMDSKDSFTSNEAAANYLLNWGKNKQIKAEKDSYNNVIFTVDALEGHEDAAPVTIISSYDCENMDAHIHSAAVALTAAKNTRNNGSYTVIFTPESEDALANISESYFTDDTKVFCLADSSSSRVSALTGGQKIYRLSEKLKYEKPAYDKAYRISIENIPAETVSSKTAGKPNAIKNLGNLIANFKSTSLLFELASFRGGESADTIPTSASMTIVINGTDAAKFQKKMENAITKFYEKYQEKYPEIQYTYEEVDLPSKVIKKEKTDNIVSLMYTSFNGIYSKDDDGDVTAVNNIGKISTKDGKLRIDIASLSCNQDILDEIAEAYQTIAGLCGVDFTVKSEIPIFNGGQTSALLLEEFEEDFKEFTGDNSMKTADVVEVTPCSLLQEKNSSMPILYCGITSKTSEKFAGSIITFLDNGPLETEEE